MLKRIINALKVSSQPVGASGRFRNTWMESSGYNSGKFKANQRRERKASLRRKMKSSAR